jgi:type II secretory pathway pseudopilin PulG
VGVTLIELLIVMTILMMVTAAAIPLMIPALQNRRGREAARLVSSFISGARSRAIETGRPVGVMLERYNGLPFAFTLSYVEVPQPYAGDTQTSKITVSTTGQITAIGPGDTQWMNLLRYGDIMKLGYKGAIYFLSSTSSWPDGRFGQTIPSTSAPSVATPWYLVTSAGLPASLPAGYSTNGVAFQTIRQPVRSSSQPLQLPDGIVVDLINSGVAGTGGGVFPPALGFNPIFTFAPGGALDYVDATGTGLARPTGALYLLIGRRDQMPDVAPSGRLPAPNAPTAIGNLNDPDGIWITVGYQTGLVASAENAVTGTNISFATANIATARFFAQQAQSMGGR